MYAEIDQIRGQIEEIRSLLVNWGSKYTNSESRTKIEKAANLRADIWVWRGLNCMQLKSFCVN
jgi:hypothetical protein